MRAEAPFDKTGLEKISQQELDGIIKKHKTFLKGIRGGARCVLQYKDLSGLDFRKSDLSQADFTGSVMREARLQGGTYIGVSFFACDLNNANFENANLARADFRGAYVAGANLTGANLHSADLREGKIMQRGYRGILEDKPFPGRTGALQKTIFRGAKLNETDLSGSRAMTADFSDADLTGVTLKNANLSGANMEGANLSHADFTGSDVTHANFKASIMTSAIMEMTETAGANLDDAITEETLGPRLENPEQTLPDMLEAHTAWIATAGENGTRLDLSGYDLRDVEKLRDYPLTAIKARGANFLGQNMEGIEMQSALLDEADLRDGRLGYSDIRGSSLKNALLTRADLTGANMAPLLFSNHDGTERLQKMDLSGANLRYAVLSGAILHDAILRDADLSYAILTNADLRRADLRGAKLTGADIEGTMMNDAIRD